MSYTTQNNISISSDLLLSDEETKQAQKQAQEIVLKNQDDDFLVKIINSDVNDKKAVSTIFKIKTKSEFISCLRSLLNGFNKLDPSLTEATIFHFYAEETGKITAQKVAQSHANLN